MTIFTLTKKDLEKLGWHLVTIDAFAKDLINNADDGELKSLAIAIRNEVKDYSDTLSEIRKNQAAQSKEEQIIKAAIRLCDHKLFLLKKYHKIEFPKESLETMKDLLQGKKNLDDYNAWLDRCKEVQNQ